MIGGGEVAAPSFREERLIDASGGEIVVRWSGDLRKQYEFLRDFLEFKLNRMREVPPPN